MHGGTLTSIGPHRHKSMCPRSIAGTWYDLYGRRLNKCVKSFVRNTPPDVSVRTKSTLSRLLTSETPHTENIRRAGFTDHIGFAIWDNMPTRCTASQGQVFWQLHFGVSSGEPIRNEPDAVSVGYLPIFPSPDQILGW